MHILVIEDEVKLAVSLQEGFRAEGWEVTLAQDGISGLKEALIGSYDVVILDRTLPGLDGMGVLQALRSERDTPVLMLTALGEVQDRISGLRSGADDYLAKPFSFSELTARVEALSRRTSSPSPKSIPESNDLTLAGLSINTLSRRVTRNGNRISLSPKEFDLLKLLLQRQGRVVSRREIADCVWGMNFDGDHNVIEVAIRRLRSKVDAPFDNALVHTVRGIGYILEDRT